MEWRYDIDAAGAGAAAGEPGFFFLVSAEGPCAEDGGKTWEKQVGEAWRHEDGLIYWASQGPQDEDPAIATDGWGIIAWQPMPAPAERPPGSEQPETSAPAKPTKAFLPLSRLALVELQRICRGPVPRYTIANKRVADRLLDEKLVCVEQLASPLPSHRGKLMDHFVATAAGHARAAEEEA